MNEEILVVNDLLFAYGDHKILDHLSFNLKKGEIAALIGASGSGKSTIFKLLTGLLTPQLGTITIANESLPEAHRHVAYMMQEDLLLPWRTVINNITLVKELGTLGVISEETRVEALWLLKEIGMAKCGEMFPQELSGGMRQRVSLARALLQKRPLLLLDEPFGSLDVSIRDQLYHMLKVIRKKFGTTMLMVTHDFRDALSLADHVFLLGDHQIYREWKIDDSIRENPIATEKFMQEMREALHTTATGSTSTAPTVS